MTTANRNMKKYYSWNIIQHLYNDSSNITYDLLKLTHNPEVTGINFLLPQI